MAVRPYGGFGVAVGGSVAQEAEGAEAVHLRAGRQRETGQARARRRGFAAIV